MPISTMPGRMADSRVIQISGPWPQPGHACSGSEAGGGGATFRARSPRLGCGLGGRSGWLLVAADPVDADGAPTVPQPFGDGNFIGRVVLTAEGRLSAAITDARTEIPEGQTRDYSCYTGKYTFDGKTLITRVDACSDPARMGTEQIRDVTFEDGLMILRPPMQSYGDKPVERRTLWWRKISDE